MKNDIALRLKVLRRKAGLSQGDCAHLLGINASRLSTIELGKVPLSIRELTILALVFGTSLDSLLAGSVDDVRRGLAERLSTLPPAPTYWLKRFNRHHTLNALAVRLEALSTRDHDGAA